ncbi:MAG: hypothetical protein CMP58_00270 [Flavobacteriales bacterium]|nr:hypothetical protein [Flavobacteriales bacterium]|tara:strand:- start:439 stop:987 length:549 start_codon:yes stop_codon:yes gene_type:complete
MKFLFFVFCFFFSFSSISQNVSIEIKKMFSGETTIFNGTEENVFDLENGTEGEVCVVFKTTKNYNINTGLNYSKAKIDENRRYNSFSGVLKAEGDFFSRFFKEQDFKITVFLGARPGIGRFVFSSGDDLFLSFSTEIGFKVKYKNLFLTMFSVNEKGFQEPNGGINEYSKGYLGASLGLIIF